MTRKHFRVIAATVRLIPDLRYRRQQANRMAVLCRKANPRFDRIRFLKACGV